MTRVREAIHELDRALADLLVEEERHGVPREVTAETALAEMPPRLVRLLLDYMPTIAGPWRIVDMRDGEPTKLVRDGYGDVIATVRRCGQGRRARPRWSAFVGNEIVSPPHVDEHTPIDWSTCEEAQAACDGRLRESGVTIVEESK